MLTPFVGDKSITECDSEYKGGDKVIHDQAVGQLENASGMNISKYLYL